MLTNPGMLKNTDDTCLSFNLLCDMSTQLIERKKRGCQNDKRVIVQHNTPVVERGEGEREYPHTKCTLN